MKKFFILLIFPALFACDNIIKNKSTSIDFNCPRVFFTSEDRIFINGNNGLDSMSIKAKLNNYAINERCKQNEEIAIIPLDILIIAQPFKNINNSEINLPVYISLLDQNDNLLETQYFMISGSIKKNLETNKFIESEITDRLSIITKYLETSQIIIGFMLDNKKRNLLD